MMSLIDVLTRAGIKTASAATPTTGDENVQSSSADGFRDALAATLGESSSSSSDLTTEDVQKVAETSSQGADAKDDANASDSRQEQNQTSSDLSAGAFLIPGMIPLAVAVPQTPPSTSGGNGSSSPVNGGAGGVALMTPASTADLPAVVSQSKPPALPAGLIQNPDSTNVSTALSDKSAQAAQGSETVEVSNLNTAASATPTVPIVQEVISSSGESAQPVDVEAPQVAATSSVTAADNVVVTENPQASFKVTTKFVTQLPKRSVEGKEEKPAIPEANTESQRQVTPGVDSISGPGSAAGESEPTAEIAPHAVPADVTAETAAATVHQDTQPADNKRNESLDDAAKLPAISSESPPSIQVGNASATELPVAASTAEGPVLVTESAKAKQDAIVPVAIAEVHLANQKSEASHAARDTEVGSAVAPPSDPPPGTLPDSSSARIAGTQSASVSAIIAAVDAALPAAHEDSAVDNDLSDSGSISSVPAPETGSVRGGHEVQDHLESDVPVGTDPARVVADVAHGVRGALRGGHEIHIHLDPVDLGGVRIDVVMRDGQLTARLEAERPSSQRLLADNLHELREQLTQQGVQVDRIEVVRSGERSSVGWSQSSSNSAFQQRDRQQFAASRSAGDLREPRSEAESESTASRTQPAVPRTARGKIKQLDIFV